MCVWDSREKEIKLFFPVGYTLASEFGSASTPKLNQHTEIGMELNQVRRKSAKMEMGREKVPLMPFSGGCSLTRSPSNHTHTHIPHTRIRSIPFIAEYIICNLKNWLLRLLSIIIFFCFRLPSIWGLMCAQLSDFHLVGNRKWLLILCYVALQQNEGQKSFRCTRSFFWLCRFA